MRRNAGTKSKVSMIVYGDEHDSEPRSLEYPERSPFQRGSQDTFLLTTPFSMGTIQYIRIWHDNAGGSWFLSRIMVIDLQTDERYYFICNRWLAVDEEDGQVGKNLLNHSSYFSSFPAIAVYVRWARFLLHFGWSTLTYRFVYENYSNTKTCGVPFRAHSYWLKSVGLSLGRSRFMNRFCYWPELIWELCV